MCNVRLISFFAAFVALGSFVGGCASGPTIRVDRDPTVNLASYGTFAFFDEQQTDRVGYSSILTEHLKRATRSELERLGYVYDETEPQLRVNFIVEVQERQELRGSSIGPSFFGPRGYGAWGGYDLATVTYKAGTLRIDLVDVRRNALVWQGVAEGTIGKDALQHPGVAVNQVVVGLFREFPGSPAA